MPLFINYNGRLLEQNAPIVSSKNRGFRYGDGLFETIRLAEGQIQLHELHFERLLKGLQLLQFSIPEHFTKAYLREQIISLCAKNNVLLSARVRLNVFRKDGGLYDITDHNPNFIIEATALAPPISVKDKHGLVVDIYDRVRKSCDAFSHLKSNNYLAYAMGALYAQQNNFNDCFILNAYERICDATIANVFCIKGGFISTPPLTEGCVAGVMRRHLLQTLPRHGYLIEEKQLLVDDLLHADELFLTNAITGIRWIGKFRNREYTNTISSSISSLIF